MTYTEVINFSRALVNRIRTVRGYKNYTKLDMVRTQANFERVEVPHKNDHMPKYVLLKRMAQRLGVSASPNKSYNNKTFTKWRFIRYEALKRSNGACECCHAMDKPLQVDHIKPKSLYPDLEFTLSNLQVLCGDCNIGKGNWDETDWRDAKPASFEDKLKLIH